MWKKDNPNSGADTRNTSGLEGVRAQMPGSPSPDARPSSPAERGQALSLADIASTPIPAAPNAAGQTGAVDAPSAPTATVQTGGGSAVPPGGPAIPGGPGIPGGPTIPGGSSAPQNGSWKPLLEFHGTGWEYFKLLLVNFLLSMVTLGIYSFWGRTKIRAYLWSRTRMWGEPMEYTGTGKELFISFLIVMPILLVIMFVSGILMQMAPLLALVVFYPGLIFAILFASYRALRYRLTRTRWRGIRGNLSGSATAFAAWGMLYIFAILFSLGLATPWANSRLIHRQLNNVWFGNRQLSFHGSSKELYKAFLLMMLGIVVISAVLGGIVYAIAYPLLTDSYAANMDYEDLYAKTLLVFTIFYFVLIIAILLVSAYYHAHFVRWLYRHMAYGKVRSRSRMTGGQVLKLRLTNLLIFIFTLGIGYAWTHIRTLRLYLHTVDYTGDPEFTSLLQDTQAAPGRGEGLLDALDVDIAF